MDIVGRCGRSVLARRVSRWRDGDVVRARDRHDVIVVRCVRIRRGGSVVVVVMMRVVVLPMFENDGEATVGGVDRDVMVAVRHEVQSRQARAAAPPEGD
jgi:hypothetical protein